MNMRAIVSLFSTLVCLLITSAAMAKSTTPYRVAILMFDDVQIIDFAAPYEVFGHAGFDVVTVSTDGKPVTTVMGLNVTPDHSFASLPKVDAIVVPGGNVGDAMSDQQILAWLNTQQGNTEHILSVCTGSYILAETGLLDGKGATTFHRALNGFERDYPEIQVRREERFVDNGQIITSAGLSSGIDAALHLVSRVKGLDSAITVALHLEYDWQPEGGFVRALLADRMLPDNDYDWPENTNFSRMSAYGDEQQWQITYSATSSADLDTLVDVYRRAMQTNSNWQAQPSQGTDAITWRGKALASGWQHILQFSPQHDDNSYTFKLIVERAET